jgi:F0F1-type ATP synthase epsilon subunit
MNTFGLRIISPTGVLFDKKVSMIRVVGKSGVLNILANHAPMIIELAKGPFQFRDEEEKELSFEFDAGFVRVESSGVTVTHYRLG